MTQNVTQAALGTTGARPLAEASGRLMSLDVFRGMAVLLMLLVNFPGDWHYYYAPISHAGWHGFHLADLVFPAFLYIVGVSLVYALASVRAQPGHHTRALVRVGRRALVMVLLGILIMLLPYFYFTSVRIPGVLQRIGVVFLLGSVLYLKTSWRTQALLLVLLLAGYAALLQLVPVPGIGPANLEPATNLGAWLDRTVLGNGHLHDDQLGWDPESLLGTLPALGTTLLGMLSAQWLRGPRPAACRVRWLLWAGVAALGLGLLWHPWFPINKSLWTSSFVLYSGGWCILLLATLYWVCDVRGRRGAWTTLFLVYGVNAFSVFFLSEAVERVLTRLHRKTPTGEKLYLRDWLYQTHFVPHFVNPYHASLVWDLVYLLFWTLLLYLLYRKRIIIKV
ncbi:acyltransferase family protein [Hymenobacter rubripertinctus]|uniref:DUF1624 domain-containing protein n=1 Tax=Hymenobacter rubripertinctus TaxID=2029981 RepID=A0A418QSZ7_9BACT|nr:heparan-alpha-glucosaminide N-acetyltransferase domain-containing protein [Hymenobacter rubripertinctus]RIY08198.1 DUF1624 domain-containing protein [Hymenobacter rubripertinctus]